MFDRPGLKLALVAAWVLLIPGAVCAEDLFSPMGVTRPKARVEAPAFILTSLEGGERGLEDYKGKVILLNFWATHCLPCREEMPAMDRLWKEFKDRGFVILAVAGDRGFRGKSRVEKFIKGLGVTFPVVLDPAGDVRRTYEVTVLPMSYIIGKDGKFIGRVIGERQWDGPEAFELVEGLLE